MKELLPVGCVIMASGQSQRFGSNKLLAPFCGEPMLCRAFAATDTPKLSARIVVTRSDEVAQLCRSRNVPVLLHYLPGRNDTVRLGLSALLEQVPELLAACSCRETSRFCAARQWKPWQASPGGIKELGWNDKKKQNGRSSVWDSGSVTTRLPLLEVPFCLKRTFQELLTLPQGMGGSVLLRKYPAHVHTVYIADRNELADADTPEALAQLEALARQKL